MLCLREVTAGPGWRELRAFPGDSSELRSSGAQGQELPYTEQCQVYFARVETEKHTSFGLKLL